MDLTLLRSLLAVADTGAITEAAQRIGVTQSALSRRIQQLEQYFDAQLLTRSRKGVQLTAMGERVESEARVLVARFEQLRTEISAMNRLEGGTIRIGGGATAVSFILPKAIAAFQRRYPALHFQLTEAGSNQIANEVADGRIEIGLVTLPVNGRDLDVRALIDDRIVLVARADHPLAQRSSVTVEELDGLSFVGFEAGTAIRQIIDRSLRDSGVAMNAVMELRSIPAILRMVASTGTLAFVSQLGIEDLEEIRTIDVEGLSVVRKLAMVTRRGYQLSPAGAAFAQDLIR